MAIIIPSKNIYGQPQNPKIRDNIIERIEVGAITARKETLVNDNVYENTETNFSKVNGAQIENSKGDFEQTVTVGYSAYSFAYVAYKDRKNAVISISIPTLTNNKQIKKLYFDYKKELDYSITYSLIGKIEQGIASGTWSIVSTGGISYSYKEGNISYKNTTSGILQTIQTVETPISITTNNDSVIPSLKASAEVSYIEDNDTFKSSTVTLKNKGQENEYYDVTIKIPCDVTIVKLTSKNIIRSEDVDIDFPSLAGNMAVSGTYKKYNVTQIDISLFGETYQIVFDENVLAFGNLNSKKSYNVEKNELMQTTNYWQSTGKNAIEKSFAETQKQYAKGKETATIKCAIGSYKTDDNKIAISENKSEILSNDFATALSINLPSSTSGWQSTTTVTLKETYKYPIKVEVSYQWTDGKKGKSTVIFAPNEKEKTIIFVEALPLSTHLTKVEKIWVEDLPMTFTEYDEVIPMVYGADGKDHPMSRYADGSPKVFKVLGMRPFYDGSVLQELYLQEK